MPHGFVTQSPKHGHPPVIAVTAGRAVDGGVERAQLRATYLRAVERAGGIPLVVPPLGQPDSAADALIERVDGIVLTGGEDLDPALYSAPRHPATEPPDPLRDATELALVRAARERATPLLAICRGVQLLAVASGGTLVQDIPSELPAALPHSPPTSRDTRSHPVSILPGSRLARALRATTLAVNSLHHQAPATVGPDLRVVATSPDGVIEGLESTSTHWWAVGVQWHPEELIATAEPWDRALFDAFIGAVALTA